MQVIGVDENRFAFPEGWRDDGILVVDMSSAPDP